MQLFQPFVMSVGNYLKLGYMGVVSRIYYPES